MKKHVVLIKSNNPDKFNYCKFGNYKDKQGRNVNLVDVNDQMTDGYEMSHALVSLDINQKQDKRVYTFLKDHPLISNFTIEDLRANEEKNAKGAIKSAEAITTASSLANKDMNDLSILMGADPTLDEMMLKAKIIQFASSTPNKFLSLLNDMDKEHRVFLKKALDKHVLNKVNGVWKHGTLSIGLTDDQVIVWLKENADVYALLKHQLRTGEVIKIQEVVKEMATEKIEEIKEENPVMSSSTLNELEQDVNQSDN